MPDVSGGTLNIRSRRSVRDAAREIGRRIFGRLL
jgi:hypothetical protein